MNILEKIDFYYRNKKYCKILRKVGEDTYEKSNGYIVDFSKKFIVLQETDDFIIRGYLIIPTQSIQEIICSLSDKYFDKIIKAEGIIEKVEKKYELKLNSWETVFDSIQNLNLNVIIKNENPDEEDFNIGQIIKITKKSIYIKYFDSKCYLDSETTKINFESITIVNFDDIYINILSKYLREKKSKS
jgi:hypothetical protein